MADEKKSSGINVAKLNETYRRATGQQKDVIRPKVEETQALLGFDFGQVDDIADTFCDAWTKVRPWLKTLFKMAAWMPGAGQYVVMAKAVIAAIDENIIPLVCEAPVVSAATATVTAAPAPAAATAASTTATQPSVDRR